MADVLKTEYMGKPNVGYSEYMFKTDEAREATSPKTGDRCVMKNGDVYFCWEQGTWEKLGGNA